MHKIAIIGGGPGGLFTTYLLQRKAAHALSITVFEASDRIGGKILTKQFSTAPVRYEAGAAELYGYSKVGSDPLHHLVRTLGLPTISLHGQTVVLGDRIMRTTQDIRRHFGRRTLKEIKRFQAFGKSHVSPREYYDAGWPDDNRHVLTTRSFETVLAGIRDDMALRYVKVAVHSDLASEPHQVSGLFGIQNTLLTDPSYVQLYSIHGGLERLTQGVAQQLRARIQVNCPVVGVQKSTKDGYDVLYQDGNQTASETFDTIVLALPVCWFPTIEWRDRKLRRAMQDHHAYYSNPAHYLRITLLFRRPFWRHLLFDSYFQLDAFGGCCVYDEGAKQEAEPYGVLSWLVAGTHAMLNGNLDDRTLVRKALESLPAALSEGPQLLLEGCIDRWVGAVTAHAPGRQIRGAKIRHTPEPRDHPRLFVVGDYLFDATINGTLDSAEIVSDLVLRSVRRSNGLFTGSTTNAAETYQAGGSGWPERGTTHSEPAIAQHSLNDGSQ
jgi:monoamine oxidase